MQRMMQHRDRGAVAVWVALLMIPFMIIGALAIDVAGMHADRQRLQTGADAAALAVAQECAAGACAAADATAQELATANDPLGGPALGVVTDLQPDAGWVEVQTSSQRNHWFAPVIGEDTVGLAATAAAAWGYPGAGKTLPVTFSICQLATTTGTFAAVLEVDPATGEIVGLLESADGAVRRLVQTKTSDANCTDNSGNALPGGFGWLAPDTGCEVTTSADGTVTSGTGGSVRPACETTLRELVDSQAVSLLPVFSGAASSGANGSYTIAGYIAVSLQGYRFHGGTCYPAYTCTDGQPPGNGSGWLDIKFHSYVETAGDFELDPDAPDYGAQVVQLRMP